MLSAILDYSTDLFAYWQSIREVYSIIDRLHVTDFIQSVFDILVRGEINFLSYHKLEVYMCTGTFPNPVFLYMYDILPQFRFHFR